MQDVGLWLDQNIEPWMSVDPETFLRACVEMEVWSDWAPTSPMEMLEDYFEQDLPAAAFRFADVAVALSDGTLAEFTFDTDSGQIAMPEAIFLTAATAPFDDAGEMLDRRARRRAIADALTEVE